MAPKCARLGIRSAFYAVLGLALAAGELPRAVNAADPQLSVLEPQGGQRGTSASVVLRGARLGKEPQELLFYEPGISVVKLEPIDDNAVRAELAIADDCAFGAHSLRLRTSTGLSDLRQLFVGALPEIDEVEPNSSFDEPQPLELGVVVRGVIQREDVDYFIVNAQEGDRLSVEVEGLRLGRSFFDPAVAIMDENRFEIAVSDDATLLHSDPCLTAVAPKTGKYIIELRETAYRGDDSCTYRMHVGRFPRPTAVYPPGGKPGEEVEVRWIGDASGEWTQKITLPEASQQAMLAVRDEHGEAPSGAPVRIDALPQALEQEPNATAEEATRCEAPGACCGILTEPGDHDRFRFTAKKGEVFDIRAVARGIRSPVDAILRVLDGAGKRLEGNDDDAGEPDSYIRFTVPEDGEYLVEVEDHLGQGGPGYVYRIELKRPSAIAEIKLDERRRYEATVIEVPQGGRTAAFFTVGRRDFGGEVSLAIDDLPPGVKAEFGPLAADYNIVPVVFSSNEETPLAGALAPVTAKLVDGSQEIQSEFEQQTWFVRGENNRPVWSHFADRMAVAVTKKLPVSIRVVEPQAPLVQNGSKELSVVAERADGFDGQVAVRMLYDPPGVSSNASRRIEPGQTEVAIPITANGNARTGDWPIAITGEVNIDGRVYIATEFVNLKIATPYLALTLPTVATKQGESTEFTIDIETLTPFTGAANAVLQGLPAGATAEAVEFDAEAKQIVFQIAVAKDARTGRHKSLNCSVTLTENGEPVQHTLGQGELAIDPVVEEAAAGATAATNAPTSGGS